ncbi:hypothetical protein E1301_Tti010600 [Triplophysa tibetana]|uniref:Uncharacterized protein n=1 Tax=Triplophysa tibetana TaxID=1572043 RepID=A0A5A9PW35_9TELE|nr:hypothetical protein E1301_Tti010600 [Triplophysa tibetana]
MRFSSRNLNRSSRGIDPPPHTHTQHGYNRNLDQVYGRVSALRRAGKTVLSDFTPFKIMTDAGICNDAAVTSPAIGSSFRVLERQGKRHAAVLRSETRAKKRLFLPLFSPDFLELEVGDTRMFVLCPAAKIWQIVPPAALQ